ncbi:MAG: hypothetical protein ACMZI0_17875 [Symbiopectobacterium sp.]|uniref:hypothetical protein n=1 Tax=Symbiopectobacterium sp. TaxID=2952789 RepID=UPI0039EA47CF
MNRELSQPENITDNIAGCANEDVALAVKDFIKAPDKVGCVYGFIHTQSQASLPEELRDAKTTVESREIFKSILGMLSTKAENFSSTEKVCYQKLCDHLSSEIKNEQNETDTKISLKKQIKNISNDDKQFWVEVSPLLQTYGKEILEDLTAHMLNQSINAWCEYHNVTDRDEARENIEQIFDTTIRMCFNIIDDEVMGIAKEAKSAIQDREEIHGAFMRFGCMKVFDAVASIPLALRRQAPIGAGKPSTSEKAAGTADAESNINGHQTPKMSSSPGNITVYGGNATATSYGGNTPTTPPDPWSSMTEKLLASDKLNKDQCFLFLKDLIATMGERREASPSFFSRYPLLSRLNGISSQDLPAYSTLPNGHGATHSSSDSQLDAQRVPNMVLPAAYSSSLNAAVAQAFSQETGNVEPSAPTVERDFVPDSQVKRRPSTSSSIGSGISTMSPPRSPLENFNIGTLSRKQNINPLASLGTYRRIRHRSFRCDC